MMKTLLVAGVVGACASLGVLALGVWVAVKLDGPAGALGSLVTGAPRGR